MERFITSDPQVLEYRSGGGCSVLLGIPFFLGGLLTMAAPLLDGGSELAALAITIPFGGIFACAGVAVSLGRSRLTFDRRRGVISSWWGILGMGPTTETPLAGRERVTMATEVRGSGKSRHTVYVVRLEGGVHEPHEVGAPSDEAEARRLAEEVAKFLDVGIVDRCSGDEVVREAGTLDESVRDRLARLGRKPEALPRPPDARSRHTPMGSTQRFDIPATGFNCGHVLICVLALIFAVPGVVAGWAMASEPDVPAIAVVIVSGVFLLPGVAIFLFAIADSRTSWFVEATPMRLLVERHGLVRVTRFEFPGHELEELAVVGRKSTHVVGGPAILARSDRLDLRFGSGLAPEELSWIASCLEVGLCS